ncbi:FIST signal transduction protein [Acidihalobacter ferrooxydans]|uniref:FIST domain-containing protein n=1 Tax=Acidihalobacter ferrooxydans TaxID=1765967 RepID=A0A1P8UEE6_9GAMM|nr:FIST N-terminal domain-containing protein [Acidihalobacter ferrooxydans]APZ42159.1 hypothetical protein BW247_02825 [Acidihalobacter ferrooxydans]
MHSRRLYLREDWNDNAVATFLDALPATQGTVLVQVFSSFADHNRVLPAVRDILRNLPGAVVIGASTAGEIDGGTMREQGALLLFTLFEHCSVRGYQARATTAFEVGRTLAQTALTPDTRCVIAFANSINTDGDEFLRGFAAANPAQVPLAGGMSADSARFEHCRVLLGDTWLDEGAVGVAIDGASLRVYQDYNLSWRPIGRPMRVTKARGDVVYGIEGRTVVELYTRYLGSDIAGNLPRSAFDFPLFIEFDGLIIPRTMMSRPDASGGVQFAGDIPEGAQVRFGIVNNDAIVDSVRRVAQQVREQAPEALFA